MPSHTLLDYQENLKSVDSECHSFKKHDDTELQDRIEGTEIRIG